MRKILPLTLTGLLALSACQFTSDGDDAGTGVHALNDMKALPLHAYLPDPASTGGQDVGTAQWILARQCMIRLGFTGFRAFDVKSVESTYPVRQGSLVNEDGLGDDSPYGVDDPAVAAEHGYHNGGVDTGAEPREWPADQYTALTGSFESGESHRTHGRPIPEGGCLGAATRKIYGSEPRPMNVGGLKLSGYYSLATELWIQARKEAGKDPAWKKADRAWSRCMKDKGFHYPDPDKASVDYHWFTTHQASGKEKKTAVADARCKLGTDYIQTAHRIEVRTQNAAIARHKKALEDGRAADQQAIGNARRIIAEQS
ncbi:hypothetical protein [Streptomyces sp. NPDC047028]|uniref:hypothetical protein n=1 Tax=Streptomyces sp. NPDC047028 TaxID=3155793 RepID=UPI0033EECB1A